MFTSYLQVHHSTEDDVLWPPMRTALAEDSAGLALLDAEHGKRIGADVQRYLPWGLDDASPDIAEKLLALLPPRWCVGPTATSGNLPMPS